MKRVADDEETVVLVPIVVVPVQVQLPLVIPPVQAGDVAVAIRVMPDRAPAMYKVPSVPLPIEYSLGCILFGSIAPPVQCTKCLHF